VLLDPPGLGYVFRCGRTCLENVDPTGTTMKKPHVFLSLLALIQSTVLADFSQSQATLHPRLPAAGPFIIEIGGTWPTDCHPGEQKPVVAAWDGQSVRIEFEIIVVHVTCNDVDTPYRVLADMSEAVRSLKPLGDTLDLRIDYQGATWEQSVPLVCPPDDDCDVENDVPQGADAGLYHAPNLQNQGLLVARQNEATAIYSLVYDESGPSRWVFAGNLMREDAFFAEILEFSGGDCLGCEPTGTMPDMTRRGYLTALADRPGALQVKVNDGLFTEYLSVVYGYRTFAVGPAGAHTLVDLDGRWAIRENRGTNPPLGDLTTILPGVFDVELEHIVTADSSIQQDGEVSYRVAGPDGEPLGQLVCRGETALDGATGMCAFIDPTDAAEPLFLFYQLGPYTLAIEYGRPLIDIGIPPGGQAVRLD
jgi:hypothetical protein